MEEKGTGGTAACGECGDTADVSICTCQYPWKTYCSSCFQSHSQSPAASGRKHALEPLRAREFLVSNTVLPDYYERQYVVEHMLRFIRENEEEMALCVDHFAQFAADLQGKLEEWVGATRSALLATMSEMRAHISEMTDQLTALRYHPSLRQPTRLAELLASTKKEEVQRLREKLKMFSYAFKPYLVTSVLGDTFTWQYRCEALQASLHAVSFNSETQRCTQFCLADKTKNLCEIADLRIRSGAAWCVLPATNEILYCGGQNNSVVSRDTSIVDLTKRKATPQAAMGRERFSHAIAYLDEGVYVFGGNSGNAALSHCECFSLLSRRWAAIASLNTPRYGASACTYKSSVFIAGGQRAATCEVYIPSSDAFTTMALSLPASERFTTVLAGDEELFILQDQTLFQWSLAKVNRTLQRVRDLPVSGNWLSPLQPITHRNVCYFLRCDYELWELDLETKALILAFPL